MFLSCFSVMVLPGKFCEEKEHGRSFHLENDFLIYFSVKWWSHKPVFEETLNQSLLFCFLIKLHQRLISEDNEGNLKKCIPVAVPSLSQNVLGHPKAADSLPLLVFFAEAEESSCVSFSFSV